MSEREFTAIGVDVGGTKIAIGIVTFPGGVLRSKRTIPTLPQRGAEQVLEDVERVTLELAAEIRAANKQVDGIGLGLCELVDRQGEIVSSCCLDWTRAEVCQRLSTIAPTVIEADVRAGALAESLFGAGRLAPVFLYISIGTGISSCLVVDGRPFLGNCGATGTLASGPLPRFDPSQNHPPAVSLEQIASGPALVSRYNDSFPSVKAQSAQEVLAAAEAGNEKALAILLSAAKALGGSIGGLVNVLDPAMVILGGGLGSSQGIYFDQLVKAARRHIWWDGHRSLPLVRAQTGPDAGLIGAAATAWKRFGQPTLRN